MFLVAIDSAPRTSGQVRASSLLADRPAENSAGPAVPTSAVRHFFVLYRADGAAEPWRPSDLRARLADLPSPWSGPWQLCQAGPVVLGWAGGAAGSRATDAPLLVWAGELTAPAAAEAQSHELAARLAAGGWEGEFPLDGAFAAVALDPAAARAALVTDRFGLFLLYHLEQAGLHAYATSLRVLTALTRPTCHVDVESVYQMLCLQLILDNRTLLREVRLVPPASTVLLHSAGPAVAPYWEWARLGPATEPAAVRSRDLVRETYALIERAVLRAVPAGARRIGVPLSGGLDSRMLAAVLAKNGVPFRAYNLDFGREHAVARRVADTLRVPLRVLPMLAEPAAIPEAHEAIDCAYHVNQVWGWDMARRAAAEDGCDLFLDGLAFDTILGSVHHVGGDDPGALARALQGNYQDVDEGTLASVAGREAAAAVQGSLWAALLEAARVSIGRAGPRASDHFLMNNRISRYTFGYCLANLRHLPCGFPYVTRELFEHCLRLPLGERLEHNLYRRIYRELFPELARIPWAKTGLPLDRYGPPRGQNRWLLRLVAVVRRLTRGRANFQGKGSFDADFRKRPEFRAVFVKRLQADGKYLHAALPPETSANTLRGEMAGRNLGGIIQGLYTVANFMAFHAGEGHVTLAD
jgi:asparagine synthetase B (glutamine-hydrolysing)